MLNLQQFGQIQTSQVVGQFYIDTCFSAYNFLLLAFKASQID